MLKDSRSRPLAVIEAKRFSIAQRKRLHFKVFLAYEMPLPSMKTQQRLREMKIRVDELRKHHAHQRAELEALMPSVLDRAFRGEL